MDSQEVRLEGTQQSLETGGMQITGCIWTGIQKTLSNDQVVYFIEIRIYLKLMKLVETKLRFVSIFFDRP